MTTQTATQCRLTSGAHGLHTARMWAGSGPTLRSSLGFRCRTTAGLRSLTFQTAGPPQARVGHHLLVFLAGLVLVATLRFADAARVQPIVGSHGDGHQTEGGEGAHRGQEHLHPALKHSHAAAFHERGDPFPLDV